MGRLMWLGIVLFWSSSSLAADTAVRLRHGVTLNYHETVSGLRFLDPSTAMVAKTSAGKATQMQFEAFSRRFELSLRPNASLLTADLRNRLAEQGIQVFRGEMVGIQGSWARLVVDHGIPRGLIFDGEQLFSIEAPGDTLVASSGSPVIYRLADLVVEPGQLGCAIQMDTGSGADAFRWLVGELKTLAAQAPGATQSLNLGAIADFEFSSELGSGTEAALLDRFSRVDGIFSTELGVQISVAHVDIFTEDTDPFTESEASLLLNQLAFYRSNTQAQRAQGLSHLFTGRDLEGTTVGIAFVGTLCNNFAGAGLSEGRRSPMIDSLIAAHELGHNFGAGHDGDPPCEDTPLSFLMAPSINGSNEFSQCSKDQMAREIAAAGCVVPLADVDMAAFVDSASLTVLAGTDFSYGITLDNQGTEEATDVAVNVQVPAELGIQAALPSAGTCGLGGGSADCSLGQIPGNSTRSVQLTLQASAPGDFRIDVSVTAGSDSDPANNHARGTITANPAVDLALSTAAGIQVNVDAATDIDVTLSNNADLPAHDVNVSFTLAGGLRAETASYALGSCAVTARQVDCGGGTLSAGSSTDLSVTVTGIASGAQSVDIVVTSGEAELDDTDNAVSTSVNVRANTAATSRAGGGGALLWSLLLLLLASPATRGWHRKQP